MEERSLGNALKREREIKGLTVEKVAEDLKIRAKFIDAMEKENFGEMPGEVYVKAFLRSYSEYLGLNPDEILGIFAGAKKEKIETDFTVHHPIMVKEKKKKNIKITKEIKLAILIVLFLALIYAMVTSLKSCVNNPRQNEIINTEITTNLPPLILEAEVTQDKCWVEIIKDNEGPLKMYIYAGEKKVWYAKEEFNLLIGNKDGIKLTLNGKNYDITNKKTNDGVLRDLIIKREVTRDAK